MNVRNILLTAAIATLVACGGRDDNTEPDSGLPTGCTGACNDSGTPDSGTPDAGPNSCSAFIPNSGRPVIDVSTDPDSGTVMTLAQLRYGRLPDAGFVPFHGHALINNAVVTAVSYISQSGNEGFWIADDSDAGFYVYKRSTDTIVFTDGGPASNPQPGDVINLDAAFNTQPKYYTDEGYRYVLANNYFGGSTPTRALIATVIDGGAAPAPLAIDANCAMDAHGGTAKLFQDSQPNAGRLVHINGPLTLTNARPNAMAHVRVELDGGGTITGYSGFEVSGGILVNDHNTYSSDGGFGAPDHCDWALLADAGSTVTFPNGISGVWESYAMHPCIALGDGGCAATGDNDYVPNDASLVFVDGGTRTYTFALYPRGCTDLPGDAGAGVTP